MVGTPVGINDADVDADALRAFHQFDADNSGTLEASELRVALEAAGLKVDEGQCVGTEEREWVSNAPAPPALEARQSLCLRRVYSLLEYSFLSSAHKCHLIRNLLIRQV